MTRKARPYSDGVSDRATSEIALRDLYIFLHTILAGLSERDAGVIKMRFGLVDGLPRTLEEIGQVYGLNRERIRRIEEKAMSTLRRFSMGAGGETVRNDLLVIDFSGLPKHVRERASGLPVPPEWWEHEVVWCERCHCPHLLRRRIDGQCTVCGCVFDQVRNGRPRVYCSTACKQRAYRDARRAARNS